MRRYWLAVFGAAILVSQVALFSLVGVPQHVGWTVAALLCFGLAGAAFVVAGVREYLPLASAAAPWYRFAGVGDLLLALGMFLNGVSMVRGDESTVFVGLIAAAGGLVLAAIGVDYLRGGVHLDTSVVQ
ncbi:hypothetical protein G9464_06480 [Halostella sp. JP-L12]|uniref:hypothetical protein n=1 Tax=Halostella TaxID=1843185 RepID=UPI0013CF376E|nr:MULTISPECIES: hypothetical protein [Halostella]NHN47244.1 hypothetical protein [Halostella sp. JP-L12]